MTINGSNVTLNARLQNFGTLNWSSANPQEGPGPNIDLGANGILDNEGTFNIQTASTESITGSGTVTNDKTMQKTGVNQTAISGTFTAGPGSTLTVNSGTLAFQGISTTSGNVVLNGGNISSVQTFDVNAGGNLSGVGTVTITGAGNKLDNSGTVTPGVNNVPGTLTIVGTYEQEGTGTLAINIDAAGTSGVLKVQGAATLAGTLSVAKNANYKPVAGTQVTFLTYTSASGDFGSKNISNNGWQAGGKLVRFVPVKQNTSYILDAQSM